MIKIIKEGRLDTFGTVCDRCKCEFEFDEREYEFDSSTYIDKVVRYVRCPYCGNLIYYNKWKKITANGDAQ